MKTLTKRLLAVLPPDGQGMGGHVPTERGFGNRSWGGCQQNLVYNEGREEHHCEGHKADQQEWQHKCPCGFRWAA